MTGKYTERSDEKKDDYLTRDLSPEQKNKFKKADKAHGKKKRPATLDEDLIKDKGIIRKIHKDEKKKK